MDEQKRRDDELFAALNRSKKQKRRKRLLTALAITAVIVIILLIVFANLRKRVEANIAADADEVLRYEVEYGSVSTTVSGSGTISDVDTETITVPEGVEIDEVLAKTNTHVSQGDVLATVDIPSELSTMLPPMPPLPRVPRVASSGSTRKTALMWPPSCMSTAPSPSCLWTAIWPLISTPLPSPQGMP